MANAKTSPETKDSLSVEIGGWFKAKATGAGVVAIPALLVLLGLFALATSWLGL